MKNIPSRLFYNKEAFMSLKFIVPNLHIAIATHMADENSLQQRLEELVELKED
jgi:hypothetical protein